LRNLCGVEIEELCFPVGLHLMLVLFSQNFFCEFSFAFRAPDDTMLKLLREVEVFCTFKAKGCEWIGHRGDLDDHCDKNCEFAPRVKWKQVQYAKDCPIHHFCKKLQKKLVIFFFFTNYLTQGVCFVCKKLLVDPVTISVCEHSFCRSCISNTNSCPVCAMNYLSNQVHTADKTLRGLLAELIVLCEDCDWQGRRDEIEKHKKICVKTEQPQKNEYKFEDVDTE
jgi:hypothetical protein